MPTDLEPTLRAFRDAHPSIQSVDTLLVDLNGILRGKRMPIAGLHKLGTEELCFPRGSTLLDTLGRAADSLPWGVLDGDPDRPVLPVLSSLSPDAVRHTTDAQILVYPVELDGTAWFACPRAVLQHQIDALAAQGWVATVAIELEFHVFERAVEDALRPAQADRTALPFTGPQTYNLTQLDDHRTLVEAIQGACARAHIPATSVLSEYGSGQFEINLKHQPDPMLACDHAVLLRRAVKAVTDDYGMLGTFMAKPRADDSGNGLHVHVSLHRDDGSPLFDGTATAPGPCLRHAVRGLLDTLPESMALLAPNANSWRRYSADFYAPTTANWGLNHRQVALRIPMSSPANLRVEHRVAGADANPYLVVAAVLAGMLHGLEQELEPMPPVEEGAAAQPGTDLPLRWREGLQSLKKGPVLGDRLGNAFVDAYCDMKLVEEEQYHMIVGDSDLQHYARTV
ncbi:MAG: glutamine synthetase family protein [Pseudomonadota bacterium]